MTDKILLYCDLNNISHPEHFVTLAEYIAKNNYSTCKAFNVDRCLVDAIRKLSHNAIDDEAFFLVWDSTWTAIIKPAMPYLTAVHTILDEKVANTLYVIDAISHNAFVASHSRDDALRQLHALHSDIYVL